MRKRRGRLGSLFLPRQAIWETAIHLPFTILMFLLLLRFTSRGMRASSVAMPSSNLLMAAEDAT